MPFSPQLIADTPPRAPCQLPRLPDVAFPQKGGAQEYGLPSRPVPRSACPQHPRTPLLLSQPSSHPLPLVVQTWLFAALRTPPFLEVLLRATTGTLASSPTQKQCLGQAVSGRAAPPSCSEAELPVQLTLMIFAVFGLTGSDFSR